MKQPLKYVFPVLLALILVLALTACSSDILPPKETGSVFAEPMPSPTPTPMPTPFDGSISGIEINQGLSYERNSKTGDLQPVINLVARRSTAVFVRLDSPLGHIPDERDYLELYQGSELLYSIYPSELSTEDSLCYLLTGEDAEILTPGEYTLRAVADNASASRGFTLTDTRALRIFAVPIRGNFGEITYPAEGWQNSFRLMNACFPVADDGLQIINAPGMDLSAERFDLRTESGVWSAWESLRERTGMLGEYDLVVGFVQGCMGSSGEYEVFGRNNIVLLNAAQNAPEMVLCHYMAQAIGIGDEYEGGLLSCETNPAPYSTAGTDIHSGEIVVSDSTGVKKASSAGLNASGSLVSSDQIPFDISEYRLLDNAVSFMGSVGEAYEHYWISSDVWNSLFKILSSPETVSSTLTLPAGSTHRLRLTGLISPDGVFTLQGSMTVPDNYHSATPLLDNGTYMLLILGGEENDEVLYRIYFDPDMLCPMDPPAEFGTVPFDLTIPVPEGGKELRILRSADSVDSEAEPFYSCIVSPNAPISSFTDTGDAQSSILRVDWETSDPDEESAECSYELYMCYENVCLLVYRGTLRYAELDMVSLPKPEQFTLLLISSDGSGSSSAVTGNISSGK